MPSGKPAVCSRLGTQRREGRRRGPRVASARSRHARSARQAPALVGEEGSARAGRTCAGREFFEGAQGRRGVGGGHVVVRQDRGEGRVDDSGKVSFGARRRERGIDDDASADVVGDVCSHEVGELVARLHCFVKPMAATPPDFQQRKTGAAEVVGDGLPRYPRYKVVAARVADAPQHGEQEGLSAPRR
eukprot:5075427-Pleurochrysis_carterae.AAC.3